MAGRSVRWRERVLALIARIRRGPCTICDAGLPRALAPSGFLHAIGDKEPAVVARESFLARVLAASREFRPVLTPLAHHIVDALSGRHFRCLRRGRTVTRSLCQGGGSGSSKQTRRQSQSATESSLNPLEHPRA